MNVVHTLSGLVRAHTVLPAEAQAQLRAAALTPNPPGDPRARQRAIDAACERIQLKYPYLFHPKDPA